MGRLGKWIGRGRGEEKREKKREVIGDVNTESIEKK